MQPPRSFPRTDTSLFIHSIVLLSSLSWDLETDAPAAFAKLYGRWIPNSTAGDTDASDEFVAYVTKFPTNLGRRVINDGDIALSKSKSVSRHHATLLLEGENVLIRCEGKNGLSVNRKQIENGQQCLLAPGDAVKIGCYHFYYCEGMRKAS